MLLGATVWRGPRQGRIVGREMTSCLPAVRVTMSNEPGFRSSDRNTGKKVAKNEREWAREWLERFLENAIPTTNFESHE